MATNAAIPHTQLQYPLAGKVPLRGAGPRRAESSLLLHEAQALLNQPPVGP